jgi:hypothetical protein
MPVLFVMNFSAVALHHHRHRCLHLRCRACPSRGWLHRSLRRIRMHLRSLPALALVQLCLTNIVASPQPKCCRMLLSLLLSTRLLILSRSLACSIPNFPTLYLYIRTSQIYLVTLSTVPPPLLLPLFGPIPNVPNHCLVSDSQQPSPF